MFYMVFIALGFFPITASAWSDDWLFVESCNEAGNIDVTATYTASDSHGNGTVQYISPYLDLNVGAIVTANLVEDNNQTESYTIENINNCTPPQNLSPTANAGPDQTITLPTNSVTLSGSGTDSDGTIVLPYVWSFVSGPSTVDPLDTASSSATGLVAGTYVFQLIVTDDDGATGMDTVSITVNPESVSQQHSSSGSISGYTQLVLFVPGGKVLGASTCGPYLYTYMKYGSSQNDKNEVVKLQIFLNEY